MQLPVFERFNFVDNSPNLWIATLISNPLKIVREAKSFRVKILTTTLLNITL